MNLHSIMLCITKFGHPVRFSLVQISSLMYFQFTVSGSLFSMSKIRIWNLTSETFTVLVQKIQKYFHLEFPGSWVSYNNGLINL